VRFEQSYASNAQLSADIINDDDLEHFGIIVVHLVVKRQLQQQMQQQLMLLRDDDGKSKGMASQQLPRADYKINKRVACTNGWLWWLMLVAYCSKCCSQ
jgi:hypothetical protein